MGDKERGIDAESHDFARYEQVDKPRSYRLAESVAVEEQYDESTTVRTCDLGRYLHGDAADRRRFATSLGEAMTHLGFAVLENTGVEPGLYVDAAEHTRALFEDTAAEEKLRFRAARHGSINQGYFPIEETTEIHPDLVEGWVFCRRAFDPERTAEFWPRADLASFFRTHCERHEALILPIMQSLLSYLDVDPHLYDERLDTPSFGLRCNYYPPLSAEDEARGAGRLLGHEDVDLFTLLPAPTVEGLQVLNRDNGKWIRLEAPPGALILNAGDYLQRISNDVLRSTTHRVSRPRDGAMARAARVSFPLNVYLREDEMLEVLPGLTPAKYPPVRALEFHTSITAKYYGDAYALAADQED